MEPRWTALMRWVLAMVACAAAGLAVAGRLGVLPPERLRSPAVAFSAAKDASADIATRLEANRRGLRRMPWYGPAWVDRAILRSRATPGAPDIDALALALFLDPRGRSTVKRTVPLLLAAGRLTVTEAAGILVRTEVSVVAEALPEAPPADWPGVFAAPPSDHLLYLLTAAKRDRWLVPLGEDGRLRDLGPKGRSYVLAAVCRREASRCLPMIAPCQAGGDAQCPGGIQRDRNVIWAVVGAAKSVEDRAAARAWVRRLLPLRPSGSEVAKIAEVLAWSGDVDGARLLLRTHPAVVAR